MSSPPTKDFTDPNTPHNRVLVVEGQKFYVYAGHLSYSSEFFRALFYSNFKEKEEYEIELKELAAEDFHEFLKTLVPGNNNAITATNFTAVMACASRFIAPDILAICRQFVLANFDSLDKIEMLELAFNHDWKELKDRLATTLLGPLIIIANDPHRRRSRYESIGLGLMEVSGTFVIAAHDAQRTSFLVENEERISELSAEIHSFLFKAFLKMAKGN